MPLELRNYGPIIASLLHEERIPSLGPGQPNVSMRNALHDASPEQLFAHTKLKNLDMALACQSGLWIYHDFLDESHTISQSIENATGSYWHGIMHRREPDFSNAAYWFRRAGTHPIFAAVAHAAQESMQRFKGLKHVAFLKWDPFSFINLCETVHQTPGPDQDFCRHISLVEWQLLFDYSYRCAIDEL
jgi:hypothetical protein